jgi:hypothetical protein
MVKFDRLPGFGFKPPLRFEAAAQTTDEEQGRCNPPAIMFCFVGDLEFCG